MRYSRVLIAVGLVGAVGLYTLARGNGHMESFIILPEPNTDRIRSGEYSVDVDDMKSHYNALFANRSAQDVMQMLQAENVGHRFEDADTILFFPRRVFPTLLASYSCAVEITFEDGTFAETSDVKLCGLDAV